MTALTNVASVPNIMSRMCPENKLAMKQPIVSPAIASGNMSGKTVKASLTRTCDMEKDIG